ncbi:MAG TPA: hypothetical protein VF884_04540 [Nitrososphaeraceae archaeon]
MSGEGFNIDEGSKDYLGGTTYFKPIKVELYAFNVEKPDEVRYWINEITSDVTNIKIKPDKI